MEKSDKRDMMAAIIIQSVMIDKLKWLGEHKRTGNKERLEGLLDDAFSDLVAGTYVLVDEMLEQSSNPLIWQQRLAAKAKSGTVGTPAAPAAKTEPAASKPPGTGIKAVMGTTTSNDSDGPDMDGAKSDLSAV